MGYTPTVKPRTKKDRAMSKRAYRTSENEDKTADEMKKAKEKSNSFAEQEGEGYAKGGMVMKPKKSKKSKKPRGSGCVARTKPTKMY